MVGCLGQKHVHIQWYIRNVQCNDGSHPKASRLVWDNVVGTVFKIGLAYIIIMFSVAYAANYRRPSVPDSVVQHWYLL